MSSYVEGALVPGETVVKLGHISLWAFWHLIFFGVLLLPAFGIGLILLLMAYVRYKSTEIAVTTRRIIVKTGYISRKTVEINLNKVESLQVDQGMLGRMLDFGTLVIAGTGASHEPIVRIAEPLEFRKAFISAQDAGRRDGL